MLKTASQPSHYMGADAPWTVAKWVLVGLPYDGTCSYRPGTRFGPGALREASWGLEMYSADLDKDLEDVKFCDAGDLELPIGNREKCLAQIKEATYEVLNAGKHWVGLGGEHLVTLPVMEAHLEKYPDICLVHFDAHADLRHEYLGEKLSHAAVMRRIMENMQPEDFVQIGIRSGPREEFAWMREHHTLMSQVKELQARLLKWGDRPVFVSIDLDVMDPSIFKGTGTPEPGGLTFRELQEWIYALQSANIVGFDAVELSPHYDQSGVSNIVAAKVIREMLLVAN